MFLLWSQIGTPEKIRNIRHTFEVRVYVGLFAAYQLGSAEGYSMERWQKIKQEMNLNVKVYFGGK